LMAVLPKDFPFTYFLTWVAWVIDGRFAYGFHINIFSISFLPEWPGSLMAVLPPDDPFFLCRCFHQHLVHLFLPCNKIYLTLTMASTWVKVIFWTNTENFLLLTQIRILSKFLIFTPWKKNLSNLHKSQELSGPLPKKTEISQNTENFHPCI
jgi:hypothetical protein